MTGLYDLAPLGVAVGVGVATGAASVLLVEPARRSALLRPDVSRGIFSRGSGVEHVLSRLREVVSGARRGDFAPAGSGGRSRARRAGAAVLVALLGVAMGDVVLARPGALAALLAVVSTTLQWRRVMRRRRILRATAQLSDACSVLADAFAAGRGFASACAAVANWVPPPLGDEVRMVVVAVEGGQSHEAALEGLRRRVPTQAASAFVSTLLVHQGTGGDLSRALRNLATEFDERKETTRDVRTLQAGALASGHVTLFLGIFALMFIERLEPGTLDAVWASAPGRMTFALGSVLVAVGFVVLRRVTRVEV